MVPASDAGWTFVGNNWTGISSASGTGSSGYFIGNAGGMKSLPTQNVTWQNTSSGSTYTSASNLLKT